MWKLLGYINILIVVSSASGNFNGPYLLWGPEKLKDLKLPALNIVDENFLSSLYAEAKSIVLFVRNTTNRLNGDNFPTFKQLITKNSWAYLPQHSLAADPLDYSTNVELVTLVGPTSQQDIELAALYKDAVTIYGQGEVLGILASRYDESHYLFKREAEEMVTTTSISLTDGPTETNFVYNAPGKALLYTKYAPILTTELDGQVSKYLLYEHDQEITFDDRNDWSRLNVGFKVNNTKLRLRFNFTLSGGYWQMRAVEVEFKETKLILPITRFVPLAPKGFSYRCGSTSLIFKSANGTLNITDFQVQPWLDKKKNYFSDTYDCVGFTTIPILSGIFVSTILIAGLCIGIIALMDIKSPNRFESSRSKQLTFTIQE